MAMRLDKDFVSIDNTHETMKSYEVSKTFDVSGLSRIPKITQRYKAWSKLILKDLNGRENNPTFSLYSKDQITTF